MKKLFLVLFAVLSFISELFSDIHKHSISSFGSLYSITTDVAHPRSILEIQEIVKDAHKRDQKISIYGGGMSQGKQTFFENTLLVDMRHINHMSLDGKTLTVGAGALWRDVQNYINKYGLALQVMQGSNIFSVGGSLSVNCHGWDFHKGSISNTIKEMTIINGDGELVTLTPSDELFQYVLGGYGCFGIIADAKIELIENTPIREDTEEVLLKEYIQYFNTELKGSPQVLMHRYRLSVNSEEFFKTGVATNYLKTSNKQISSDLRLDHRRDKLIRNALWFTCNFPASKNFVSKMAKKQYLKKNLTSRNQVMSPPSQFFFAKQKNRAYWLQEFFISEDQFEDFVTFLEHTLEKNNVFLLNATVRYVKEEPSCLIRYSREKGQFALVLFFSQKLSDQEIGLTRAWVQEVIDYLIAHDGLYYLPYHHFAILDQFRDCYPNWKKFQQMKDRYDPKARFSNGFYQDYFPIQ